MMIKDLGGNIFSQKIMYEMSCSSRGKLPLVNGSESQKRKKQYENLHLTDGMKVSYNGFPILKPYNGSVDFNAIPFPDRNRASGKGEFVHFFSDDYKWGNSLWHRAEQTIFSLRKFDGMFAPDYSLYVDDGLKMFNMSQVYKSRFIGAYAQSIGYNVIPTASCGGADSINYCFEGSPENSIVGVCGTGLESHYLLELWEYFIRELEERKSPTLIIVYGPERKVIGLNTPMIFIQDQISKFHRDEKRKIV